MAFGVGRRIKEQCIDGNVDCEEVRFVSIDEWIRCSLTGSVIGGDERHIVQWKMKCSYGVTR